jgi:hypothetical protein
MNYSKDQCAFLDDVLPSVKIPTSWHLVENEVRHLLRHTADEARYSEYSLQKEWLDYKVDDVMDIIKNILERGVK